MDNLKIRNLVSDVIFPPPFDAVEHQISARVLIPSMELRELVSEKYRNHYQDISKILIDDTDLRTVFMTIEIEIYASSRLREINK